MEVKYGVYKVVGSKSELVIAYGEPHVPMRTRRKYAGKKETSEWERARI